MHRPRVVGLVGLAVVLGQPVPVPVAEGEAAEHGVHGREDRPDQGVTLVARRDRVAPRLQDELGPRSFQPLTSWNLYQLG